MAAVGNLEEAGVTSEVAGAISEATGEAGVVWITIAYSVLLSCLGLYIKGVQLRQASTRSAGKAGLVCTSAPHSMLCMCSCSVTYIKAASCTRLEQSQGLCQHFC